MDVLKLITKDEHIIKELALKGRFSLRPETKVYATNKRLIIDTGEYIREISYQHISSMMIKDMFSIPLIITGVVIALIGAIGLLNIVEFISYLLPYALSGAIIIIGLILVAFGLMKTKTLSLSVPGMPKPEGLSGTRVDLENLFIIVRDSHKEEKE